MYQEFFTDTLVGRYIKGMLSKVRIPLLPLVSEGDIILEGCNYLYKDLIIKCTHTGRIIESDYSIADNLYPSEVLFPSIVLYPGVPEKPAEYKILDNYNEYDTRSNYSYSSTCNYYDSDTHYHLGQYLRYLKHSKGLDLMPYYNCFNYKVIDNVTLTDKSPYYELKSNSEYKVAAVPIVFGRTYTIAIDCPSEVKFRCVMYGKSGLLLNDSSSGNSERYLSDISEFIYSYREYPRLNFNNPIKFSMQTNKTVLHSLQRDLYLLIQVPKEIDSSIVVLEGDYESPMTPKYPTATPITNENDLPTDISRTEAKRIRQKIENLRATYQDSSDIERNLSLLFTNSKRTFAFSDRLIEYLVDNAICEQESIPNNIYKVQKAMLELDSEFYSSIKTDRGFSIDLGLWDTYLSESLKRLHLGKCKTTVINDNNELVTDKSKSVTLPFMFDSDGNVNKDVERFFYSELGDI